MKKIYAIFILLTSILSLLAQNTNIDLRGVFEGKYRMERIQNLSWRPNSNQISYYNTDNLPIQIMIKNVKTQKEEIFLTLDQINSVCKTYKLQNPESFYWLNENTIFFPKFNISVTKLPKGNISVKEFPFSQWDPSIIDYSVKDGIFITKEDDLVFVKCEANNYQPILLCPDTGKNIIFGESVHRSEWNINEGQYISPNGNYIAFYRMDQSMVADYPLINIEKADNTTTHFIKYPMAGENSHSVTLGIFDVNASAKANKPVYHYIKTDRKDGEYLTNVTFSPDEKFIYISHLNREQNHLKLIQYNTFTGDKTNVLIEESDSRYVEPTHRMLFLKNGNFIWQSDRNGFNHCYLYSSDGQLIKQITNGNWCVTDLFGCNEKETHLFFESTFVSPVDRNVFMINISSGEMTALTLEKGTHSAIFSSDKSYFIDYFTNLETPREISIRKSDKNQTKNVLLNAKNPYKNLSLGKTEIITLKNNDNIDLYASIIYPPNFDKNKKYPCLLYVYGGPHSQLVTNTFMCNGVFLNYMAQQGYIIFTLDNRGTSNRGAEFEKCIHRQVGVLEMQDQMIGIQYLKSLPYVDSNRFCIDGWSYGGFMTLSLISTYPDIFKSATCGGPVVDWRWYEIMYGERYMDTPEENPEGYANSSILSKIKNIKADLLMFHGGQDDVVLQKNSLSFINQAIKDDFQFNYFVYPNHPHNVSGMDRVHLWHQIEKFHNKNLKVN